MSITLTAFPTAFLVSPEMAKNITLSQIAKNIKEKGIKSLVSNFSTLKSVRVITNLRLTEIPRLMSAFDRCERTGEYNYSLKNGLKIEWKYQDGYCCAILSGDPTYKIIQKYGEEFFKTFDTIKGYNVRDINSEEFFYYNYETQYKNTEQIVKELSAKGITDIMYSANEVRASYEQKNIRYHKDKENFMLEMEQKISLVNLGVNSSLLTDFTIKTNIKAQELEQLLNSVGYNFDKKMNKTNLKISSDVIFWELKDGYYNAKFKNTNASRIRTEVERLFVAMNKTAKRDLRLINNKSSQSYTYKTNYTDKGILINTLTEHGAKNISEKNENITCELFGMQMTYSKNNSSENYNLIIDRVTNKTECEGLISELNEEYGLNIQEMTYKKILERIESENLHLESEEVLDDSSIVLTIEV